MSWGSIDNPDALWPPHCKRTNHMKWWINDTTDQESIYSNSRLSHYFQWTIWQVPYYLYRYIYSVQEILPTVVQQEDWLLVGLVGQSLLTQPVNWRMYLCSPDVTVTDWCSCECECEYEQCTHILLLLHHKYNKNWGAILLPVLGIIYYTLYHYTCRLTFPTDPSNTQISKLKKRRSLSHPKVLCLFWTWNPHFKFIWARS